jgi:iron complex outermembrane receptor protein
MLEDVERIEVISGPGATLWGANAVNGVINIITRPASETQGALAAAGGGNRERATAARWGGEAGADGHYRVYAMYSDRRNSRLATGPQVNDASSAFQGGFRYDWNGPARTLTLQGDAYRADIDQDPGGSRDDSGANLLARWRQTFASGAFVDVQAYYDRVTRDQPGAISERLDTWDIELHHGFQPTASQRVLWGGGARTMHDDLRNLSPAFAFRPDANTLSRAHVFAQDEITLTRTLDLTVGVKLERNNYTGWEVLPDLRLAWRPAAHEMWWASLSRAVRSPSRIDREFFAPANPPFVFAGGPDFESEVAKVVEIGYRAQPTPAASYSVSVFHHDFDRLRSTEPQPNGSFLIENRMNGKLDGINAWGSYRVSPRWRVTGGFTRMWERRSLDAGSASVGGTAAAGNDPTHWILLGASFDLSASQELDVRVRRVGALPNPPVPAYTAVDARYGWKIAKELELSLAVQNLLDRRHPEWGSAVNRAEVARAFFLKLLWRH